MAMLSIIADVHMHTNHSHGQASVAQMYQAAIDKGLLIVGFSEHSPRPVGYSYPQDYQEHLAATFPQYIASVQALQVQAKSQGKTVLLGLEVDYIPSQETFAQTLCQEYPYDYIIGGLHFQGTWGFDGPAEEWESLSQEQCFAAYSTYYADLTRMCKTGLFQIAAHPDLIKMSSVATFHQWLATGAAEAAIDEFLSALQQAGMAMEISSAGLRKACKEIYPCPFIMERAARKGVLISFGADAHCINTPAYAFDVLAQYAHSFGFSCSTIFEQKKARSVEFFPAALII